MRKSSNKSPSNSLFRAPTTEKSWGGDGTLICPDSVRVKLPFTQTLLPGTTSGNLYYYQYRGNSGFDPDYTGVGSQPNGFDQWSAFYNTYVVLGSELIVEIIASGAYSSEIVIVPAFNTSLPASSKEAAGWRYAKTAINFQTGNGAYKKIVSRMSTAQICGVPPLEVVTDSDFSATTSASPSNNNTWYWDVFLQNISNTTTLSDVIRVTLVLDIKFMAPVQQAFSAVQKPALCDHTVTRVSPCARDSIPARPVDETCSCPSCSTASCKRQ